MNERIKFIKEIIKEKEEAYDFLKETDKESANYVLTDMKFYEEILKDLERLEQLEKENQELKEKQRKMFDIIDMNLGVFNNGKVFHRYVEPQMQKEIKEILGYD